MKWSVLSHMSQNECIHLHVSFNVQFYTGAPQGFTVTPLIFAICTFCWPVIQWSLLLEWQIWLVLSAVCYITGTLNACNQPHLRTIKISWFNLHASSLNQIWSNILFHPFVELGDTDNDCFEMTVSKYCPILTYCLLSHSLSVTRGTTCPWCPEHGGYSDEEI